MSMQIQDSKSRDITAERIAALMWRHSSTVTSLAAAIGKGRVSISTKMNSHARWYNDELVDIARVLDTTVGYLLGETDDDRRPDHLPRYENSPATEVTGEFDECALRDSNPWPSDP